MTIKFQCTRRFPENAGRLADNLLGNLERIAGVEQPYTEIVQVEELRNDNGERVIQVWGFTFAFSLVAVPYRPSHSHFLLKIIELTAITAQVHILLMSLYAGRRLCRAYAGDGARTPPDDRGQAARILRVAASGTLDCRTDARFAHPAVWRRQGEKQGGLDYAND